MSKRVIHYLVSDEGEFIVNSVQSHSPLQVTCMCQGELNSFLCLNEDEFTVNIFQLSYSYMSSWVKILFV